MGKSVYVFDLDGTLANLGHRLHFIQGENSDWDAFYENCHRDLVIKETAEIARCLFNRGHKIYIVTTRSDQVKDKTVQWLDDNRIPFHKLSMRPEDNYDADNDIKYQMLLNLVEDGEEVMSIFEDRKKVVEMWRDKGFTCYHVAEGDF